MVIRWTQKRAPFGINPQVEAEPAAIVILARLLHGPDERC
jgi:hypothetical protein